MRSWLIDRRAYAVYRQWCLSPYRQYGGGYDQIEHFREWAARITNRFFDITQRWPDEALAACCTFLVMEPPEPLPFLASFSEDELICSDCT